MREILEIEGLPAEATAMCKQMISDMDGKFDRLFCDSWEFRPMLTRRTMFDPREWAQKSLALSDRLKFAAGIFQNEIQYN